MTMKNEILFEVLGEPVAQGRPRFSSKNKVKRAIDPPASRYYKMTVAHEANKHKPHQPIEGPIEMCIDVCKPLLKSFSKVKRPSTKRYFRLVARMSTTTPKA